ncbi:MAG TPA: glycosyltransferase WbuB [Methylibium sp.]|nr:glycosyltransferase WbuB [Methylibium sp.]
MKIVLVSLNFAPELTGIGKYSGELADGLVARGHEVTVVCSPPYYPAWRVADGHSAAAYRTETPKPGLTVHRCPIWIPRRLGGLARLLHLASFALSSLPVLLRLVLWQPQVVFVVAPALFCAPAGWLLARLSGARAWLHIQDFEVDAAFELGLLQRPWLRRLALFMERGLMRRFDTVSTISRRMLRQLAGKGIPLEDTEILPNWVDLSVVTPGDRSLALRRSIDIDASQLVCLFSGTINRKQGLDVLVEAARWLQHDPRIVIVICGNGELRAGLEAAAAGLGNVRFLDLQPASELNALLNMADIHLLPQLRGAADLVMPSKLVGMLASGRPVVAAAIDGTEIASIVRDCGVCTEPESAQGFAQAIGQLADDPSRRVLLGAAGRAYAERVLDAQKIFDRLDERLEDIGRPLAPAPQPRPRAQALPRLRSMTGGLDFSALGASASPDRVESPSAVTSDGR